MDSGATATSGDAEAGARGAARGVREFYRHRHHHPAWCDLQGPTTAADRAIQLLLAARSQGLEPSQYGATALVREAASLRERGFGATRPEPERLAHFDVALARALLRYGLDLAHGRVARDSLDPGWRVKGADQAATERLVRALGSDSLAAVIDALGAPSPDARALRDALRRYRAIAARGGWPAWSERGDEAEVADRLTARLAACGDLDSSASGPNALRDALRRFQRRHGLFASGKLDTATSRQLEVPIEARIETMVWNLERLRWRQRPYLEPRIEVNVPGFALAVRDSDRIIETHAIVVGKPSHPTPIFSDTVTFLELNPTWTLTKRIIAEEILPALKRDTGAVSKQGLEVWRVDRKIPQLVTAASVDWSTLASDSFPFLVRQPAGGENPLGLVKFMCPNEYDVYLHDTNARGLFKAQRRAFSHGCVRVQDPARLALWLLRGTKLEEPDSLDAYLKTLTWRRVPLKRRVPVDFEYRTAWVDSSGTVQFRPDLYGIDRRLADARTGGALRRFFLNPRAEWAAP